MKSEAVLAVIDSLLPIINSNFYRHVLFKVYIWLLQFLYVHIAVVTISCIDIAVVLIHWGNF